MLLHADTQHTPDDFLSVHPFRWSPDASGQRAVRVTGNLPAWLRGQLVRTAPAVFARAGMRIEHWFDGHALLYGFELGQGVHFKQQLLASDVLAEHEHGQSKAGAFGTPMRRSLWQRLFAPTPGFTDNTNVNVVPWQGQWLAMSETPLQHVIDRETLATRGHYRYEDDLPRALMMSAHPHYDSQSGTLVNVGSVYGVRNELMFYRQSKHENRRVLEGRLPLKRPPYLHSFGLTPRHAIAIDHPLRINPMRVLFSNQAIIRHFRWEPERTTQLWCLERQSGKFTAFETEPLFCFHSVNAFEDGQDVVFDFLAHDDARLIDDLYTKLLERDAGYVQALPRLVRARLTPGKRSVQLERLGDVRFEFPQIAYRRCNGQPYRFVWGTQLLADPQLSLRSEIIKLDVQTGDVRRYADHDCTYGEAVFVPQPGASAEDDGVLLAVGSYPREPRSCLLVLDARTLEPLARCETEVAIPLGFHGSFAPVEPG